MGTADRDYFRDEAARYAGGGRPPMPPVSKFLFIANIVIFVVDWLFLNQKITEWGAFAPESAFGEGRVWELVSFQFLHANPAHILFNSIGLYFFAPWLENWWGSKRFAAFYLLCGAAGALFYTLLSTIGIVSAGGYLVGASAGIYGCLIGAAVIDPNAQVHLLFPPITLTIRKFALLLMGLALVVIAGDLIVHNKEMFENSGGEAGHLGGAILGFLLTRFPALLGKRTMAVAAEEDKILRPKEFKRKPRQKSKLRPRTHLDIATSNEVDRILDKINKEGMQSLTSEEQAILKEAGESRKDR
ncbi:rhomboid family intramembrane serine protease [Haloferula sp. BvORR071]|uniref:rhomboid family intramembrane serine protease n=1 Tax=Haloferula sp. BvORR071 TaxID=1396141 RepID=UPI00054E7394|nr:rhomboid family intramembrane serine protease [Haloferula sp. BvORR071]